MIVTHLPFLSHWYGQLSIYSFAKLLFLHNWFLVCFPASLQTYLQTRQLQLIYNLIIKSLSVVQAKGNLALLNLC